MRCATTTLVAAFLGKVAVAEALAGGADVGVPSVGIGEVCRPGDKSEGGCAVDGTGPACVGETVEFQPFKVNISKWDSGNAVYSLDGSLTTYAIVGGENTWQMYLHGPHIRAGERTPGAHGVPPLYVFATWTNKVYRFDNFTQDEPGGVIKATQKVAGHALAPSTGFPIEDPRTKKLKGLLIAEGQPFWMNKFPFPREVYKGGVNYLPIDHSEKCTLIFPEGMNRIAGQVVNTVDCHRGAGVCFFTVWKFYDDQKPIWSNSSAPDCLYYCLTDTLTDRPKCLEIGKVKDEHGNEICHRDGHGAVHGMTIGNDDPSDKEQFDILIVWTGGATFTNGHSSMQKLKVRVHKPLLGKKEFSVLGSSPFAVDLFTKVPPQGQDAGGDHAWVDDTGKWVWVSTFREAANGVHMVNYDTGDLVFSITGMGGYVKGQYAYSAGIHGVGTLGQNGSYLALATSACHNVNICAPIPWTFPVPKQDWAAGIFFIIDLGSVNASNVSNVVQRSSELFI